MQIYQKRRLCFMIMLLGLVVFSCSNPSGSQNDEDIFDPESAVYVVPDGSGTADGSSWDNAMGNLQAAIDLVFQTSGKAYVLVKQGTYYPVSQPKVLNLSITRYNHFSLRNNVIVIGGFSGTETGKVPQGDRTKTILSGDIGIRGNKDDNTYHVFYHPEGLALTETAKLQNVTIAWGNADAPVFQYIVGGGMCNWNSGNPELTNCMFLENNAYEAGGMYNYYSSPTLINCTFSKNSATSASGGMGNTYSSPQLIKCTFSDNISSGADTSNGGGMNNYFSNPTIIDCNFAGNTAKYGGGVFNYSSSPSFINCIFSKNITTKDGGGMCNEEGSNLKINNCTFSENNGHYGGAIRNSKSNPRIENCTFTENAATLPGGGMYNTDNSMPILINCTFSRNKANSPGGGIYNYNGSPTLINCTFSGNTGSNGGGLYSGGTGTLSVYGTIIVGNTKTESGGGISEIAGNAFAKDVDNLLSGSVSVIFQHLETVDGVVKAKLQYNGGPTMTLMINKGITGTFRTSLPSWSGESVPLKDQREYRRSSLMFYKGAVDPAGTKP